MIFKEYNPTSEKGSCIARSLSKAYNMNYLDTKKELEQLANYLKKDDYRCEEVFENSLFNHGFSILNFKTNTLVKDLDLKKGIYVIYCYKEDFYHLAVIIDNILYDRYETTLDLFTLKIYGLKEKI